MDFLQQNLFKLFLFPPGFDASTVAYAAHCQQESSLDRPVAGHTNICPGAIKNTTKDIESLSSTIKHELLHALGFSSSLFAFFRDKVRTPVYSLAFGAFPQNVIFTLHEGWRTTDGT